MTNLHTTIDGINYKVSLFEIEGRKRVWVQQERTRKDGSKVWAFLSARQRYVEGRAKSVFAAEINAHMGA